MYDTVFKAATTVIGGREVVRDVGIRKGIIEKVGTITDGGVGLEVPCEGRLLMPGAIDLHAHLREPGGTHKEDIASGTAAAVAAGITTLLEMPNTNPATVTRAALADKVAIAKRTAHCNIRFFMALTARNLDELEQAVDDPGFAGIKVYLGSTTGRILLTEFDPLERALDRIPALFAFHAELESVLLAHRDRVDEPQAADHHRLRPPEAVVEGTRLVLGHAATRDRRLHICHLSAAGELARLADATPGSRVTCEVTPHHLWFTHEDTARKGNRLKVNPPVQGPGDRKVLREALKNGLIQAVATDHAPHTREEKDRPYAKAPSGVPGLDIMVPSVLRLVQEGEITLARSFQVLCENPAAIAGLKTTGRIEEGLDADLALWDLDRTWTVQGADLRSRCGWSPFEGETLAARPLGVWVGGERRI